VRKAHRLFSFAQSQYSTPPEYPHATPHTGKKPEELGEISIVHCLLQKKIRRKVFGDINYIE
jgi:hypothetical protein